ncbi:MAG TPA: serine/threonine-protein kinase [Gemmataceae bacterium]|jgi:serine/threonine protein kinase|nr:serine/threonine-protein kinase [Gemmataceae bacterium]
MPAVAEHPDYLSQLDDVDVTQTAVIGKTTTVADASEPDDVPLPPLGAFLGRCRLRTHMAAGRNSAVYLGELWDLQIPVAVKVLAPRRKGDRHVLASHLRAEFQILSRLSHANVARLWDYRDDPESPHLATEYVESMTLEALRTSHGGRLTPKLAIRIALKTLDALAAAWRLGFAHRDIKPDNLLVTPFGDVKVIDWGMVGEIGHELPPTPSAETIRFLGSPAYLPPEMARPNRPFDHRTDMYGLGATLYHVVTGRLPFSHKKPTQMVLAHMNEMPVPPLDHVQEPGMLRLTDIILRLMAKNPADRFERPDELREELTRSLAECTSSQSKFVRVR